MSYKPDGYPAVSPYLIVADAQAVLDFAVEVFGADTLRVIRDAEGGIVHSECRIGDSVVMLGQMAGASSKAHLHVYLRDPDAALARALRAGGEQIQAMREQGDGDRRGGVRGPGGIVWWLSRQV